MGQWQKEGRQDSSHCLESGVHILLGTHVRPVDATCVCRAGLNRFLVQTNVGHEPGWVAERSAKQHKSRWPFRISQKQPPQCYDFQNVKQRWILTLWAPKGRDVAKLVEYRTGTPLTWVWFPGAAWDFSPSQLSLQTLLRSPYIPMRNCTH